MAIYSGSTVDQASAPELPLSCYHGQLYLQKAEIVRGEGFTKGIKLNLLAGKNYVATLNNLNKQLSPFPDTKC